MVSSWWAACKAPCVGRVAMVACKEHNPHGFLLLRNTAWADGAAYGPSPPRKPVTDSCATCSRLMHFLNPQFMATPAGNPLQTPSQTGTPKQAQRSSPSSPRLGGKLLHPLPGLTMLACSAGKARPPPTENPTQTLSTLLPPHCPQVSSLSGYCGPRIMTLGSYHGFISSHRHHGG